MAFRELEDRLRILEAKTVDLQNQAAPIGSVTQTARSTAPTGWLLCDGTAVSRTTYAGLFAAIGTTYGSGNGSTTFNLPNLKGRVPVGRDSGQTEFDVLGEASGSKTHTLSSGEMPSHTHVQNAHTHVQNSHNHTQNSHTHGLGGQNGVMRSNTTATGNSSSIGTGHYWSGLANSDAATAVNQATTATNQATTATNQNTGGGGAHNNLQPYLVLNFIIRA